MTFKTFLTHISGNFLVPLCYRSYEKFFQQTSGPSNFRGRRWQNWADLIVGYLFPLCVLYFYDIAYPFLIDPSLSWKLQCAEIWWFKCQNARKKKVFMAKNIYGHKQTFRLEAKNVSVMHGNSFYMAQI